VVIHFLIFFRRNLKIANYEQGIPGLPAGNP
jgi:hypothetical protein